MQSAKMSRLNQSFQVRQKHHFVNRAKKNVEICLLLFINLLNDVKKEVDVLKGKKSTQAITFPKDHRPGPWIVVS